MLQGSLTRTQVSKDTRQFGQHIVDGQANLVAKVESLALGQAQTFNALESFLADHIEQRNRKTPSLIPSTPGQILTGLPDWLTSKEQYESRLSPKGELLSFSVV